MLNETSIFGNMNLTTSTFQFFSDNIVNETLTHYISESKPWQIFSRSGLFSVVGLMWEYSINYNESIHILKSTIELN